MTKQEVLDKIALIGTSGYKDGNSGTPGVPYQPIPFEGFETVQNHDRKQKQEYAVMAKRSAPETVLDLGANIGHHVYSFEKDFGAKGTAVEIETLTFEAGKALGEYSGSSVKWFNLGAKDFLRDNTEKYDLCVFLNIHMWVWKQGDAEYVMKRIFDTCSEMFFQTAHQESGGMYRVPLEDMWAIHRYLKSFKWKPELASETRAHGGKRYMFYCKK